MPEAQLRLSEMRLSEMRLSLKSAKPQAGTWLKEYHHPKTRIAIIRMVLLYLGLLRDIERMRRDGVDDAEMIKLEKHVSLYLYCHGFMSLNTLEA